MDDTLATFFRVVVLAVAALVPIINPPGIAPIFLSMTPGMSGRDAYDPGASHRAAVPSCCSAGRC